MRPYSYWAPTGNAQQDAVSRAMVLAFGLDTIILSTDRPRDPNAARYLETNASLRGKPSLTAEAGSVRLSELERHVLGWDRGTDLLSGLIPQISFDYLRGGPPERLVPVLNHNQMDLRGLAALSSRILSLLSDAENLGQDGLEMFGVSRICEKRGEHSRARNLYEKSIAFFLPAETDRAARRSLARLAKRQGDFVLACELWKGAAGNSRHGYEAYEQLAIYYEHKGRDPEQARQIVRQALDELRCANQVGDITPGAYREIKARFDRRMERLERKSRKPLLDALAMQAQA